MRAVPGPDGELRSNVPPLNETRFLANEIVLHVLANTSPASVQQIAQQLGLTLIGTQNLSSIGRQAFRLQIGGGRSVRDIIRALEANSIVAVAQPNYQYQLVQQVPAAIAPFTASRGDPAQYTMGKLHLNEAHRVASGNNVIVAVIDSEVDREHAELAGTIAQRFDATRSESKAHSHGTAMAGAIVSRDRLLGVAPGAKILAVRAFSETQSSAESTIVQHPQGHRMGDEPGRARHQHELRRPVRSLARTRAQGRRRQGRDPDRRLRQRRPEVAAAVARRRSERDRGHRDRQRRQGVPSGQPRAVCVGGLAGRRDSRAGAAGRLPDVDRHLDRDRALSAAWSR